MQPRKQVAKEYHRRQNRENLVTNHCRSLDAATPILSTRSSCKDSSITHAAAAPSNLDPAITMRSPGIALQNTMELQRRQKLQLQNRISAPKQKKDDIEPLFKRTLQRKLPAPKLRKSADKSLSQP